MAGKLRAAVALERYRRGLDAGGKERAVSLLKVCLGHWDAVIAATRERFQETPLQHTGSVPFSWARYRDAVAADIQEAEKTNAGPAPRK